MLKSLKMPRVLGTALGTLGVLATGAALAMASVAPAMAQDVTTIKVLNWQPNGAAYWKALVAEFEKENPTIKVKLETVPNDRYPEVQGPYITTQSGPDVMENNAGLEMFERSGAYRQLPPDVLEAGKNLLTYSGACLNFDTSQPCFGLPYGYQGNVMYYNKAVLKEAGLDPANPPQTWAEMDKACKAVEAVGKTCLALGLQGDFPAYWDFPEVARNYLTEADIRDLLKGKLDWTGPKLTNVLKGLASITQQGWANSTAPSISMLPDGANIFQSGNAAFAGTIISDAVNWQAFGKALGDENVGAMRWPVIVPDAPFAHSFSGIESSVFGVTKWSRHPEAGFKFVKFMASKANAELLTKIGGGITLYRGIDPSSLPKSEALKQILEIIKTPTLHAGVMLSGQETDALARGWQEVSLGHETVADWAGQMQAALKATPSKN